MGSCLLALLRVVEFIASLACLPAHADTRCQGEGGGWAGKVAAWLCV